MAPFVYALRPTIYVTAGTSEEVRIIRWLSQNLTEEEWVRLRRDLGKRRILELPVGVLGLKSTAATALEERQVKTLADATVQSSAELGAKLHHTVLRNIKARLDLFGLELSA